MVKVITAERGDVNNGITSISSFNEPCIFRFFNEEVSQQWREKEVNAQFADTKIIGSLMIFALYAIGNANQVGYLLGIQGQWGMPSAARLATWSR